MDRHCVAIPPPTRASARARLAWLARQWLGRTIQDRGPSGHDPEADARACMVEMRFPFRQTKDGEFRTITSQSLRLSKWGLRMPL